MDILLRNLNEKFHTLMASSVLSFDEVAGMKNVMGVYMIYFGAQLIYIGKTNKFHVRFGTDLKHETTHTLVRKLIKSGICLTREDVRKYLGTDCNFRIEVCDTNRQAEALEHIAIYLLNPEYNKP